MEGSPSLPIVSVSLFGRLYNEDAEQPVNFCPGQYASSNEQIMEF